MNNMNTGIINLKLNLLLLLIITITFISCECQDKYEFNFDGVSSVIIYDFKKDKYSEINDEQILVNLNSLLNDNCYEKYSKIKMNPTFKLSLNLKDLNHTVINTNGEFFNIHLKGESLGQYKLNKNMNSFLTKISSSANASLSSAHSSN